MMLLHSLCRALLLAHRSEAEAGLAAALGAAGLISVADVRDGVLAFESADDAERCVI